MRRSDCFVHSFSFLQPVLAASTSVDGDLLGVGQSDRFSVRGKINKGEAMEREGGKHKKINRGSMRYFLKSMSEPTDTMVVSNKTKRPSLKPYDKKIKDFPVLWSPGRYPEDRKFDCGRCNVA